MSLPVGLQEHICYVVMEGELRKRGGEKEGRGGKGVGERENHSDCSRCF